TPSSTRDLNRVRIARPPVDDPPAATSAAPPPHRRRGTLRRCTRSPRTGSFSPGICATASAHRPDTSRRGSGAPAAELPVAGRFALGPADDVVPVGTYRQFDQDGLRAAAHDDPLGGLVG